MKTITFLILWWSAKYRVPPPTFKCKHKAIARTVYPDLPFNINSMQILIK